MQARYVLLPVLFALTVAVASVGPAPAGTIEGKVTYTGTPPKMKPIDMSKEPTCAKEHNPPLLGENVVTGPGNALQYVVVNISAVEQSAHLHTVTIIDNNKDYTDHPYPLTNHTT